MKKAIVIYDDMVEEGESNKKFKASTGWQRGFMKRYGLQLWRRTSVAQKALDKHKNKLVSFVLNVRHIAIKYPYDAAYTIAMDETPSGQIWSLLQ